ncbi:hypothetical protein KUV46_15780 [Thalassovita mediterranea]|nr:hypothetical protein KUV46_15780 [Thalassovita mediterranea]
MFDINERVRCVSNDWDAEDEVRRWFMLEHTPRIGGEYTVQGYVPAGVYEFGKDKRLIVRGPLLRLNELASPLDAAGVDGFPMDWFRRAVKFDTSEGMKALKALTAKRGIVQPVQEA